MRRQKEYRYDNAGIDAYNRGDYAPRYTISDWLGLFATTCVDATRFARVLLAEGSIEKRMAGWKEPKLQRLDGDIIVAAALSILVVAGLVAAYLGQ
jgi:hypothetical protein